MIRLACRLVCLMLAAAATGGAREIPAPQAVAVPAYFDPGSDWARLDHAQRSVRLVVVNPDSGPGSAFDPQVRSVVAAAQKGGSTVVGYVDTGYARRSLAAVESDVDAYYRWYGVDGIFFDDATTDCAHEPYYATLNSYVKAKGGLGRTILNPGTATSRCYIRSADILLTFEGSAVDYLHAYAAPAWVGRYAPTRFWNVVYGTTAAELAHVVQLSKRRDAGFLYATPTGLPNPYGALPAAAYWRSELTDVAR